MILNSLEKKFLEAEAERLVVEAGISTHVETLLAQVHLRRGRPRELPVHALFFAMQLMSFSGEFYLNDVAKVLNNLSMVTRRRLGIVRDSGRPITSRQVQYLVDRIDAVLRRDFAGKDKRDETRYADFDQVFGAIATAGTHADTAKSSSLSLDASDILSWGTSSRVWARVLDGETDVESWVKMQRITDPDAEFRGSKDHDYKKPVFGFEVTVATSVRDEGGVAVPRGAKAARFRPVNVNAREAALACLQEVATKRGRLGDVLVDREYTQSKHGNDFLNPVRLLGGEPVFALKLNQLGPSTPVRGAVIIDGQPFSPSIPKSLMHLVPPSTKGADTYKPSPGELAEYQAKVKARSMYALVPHGQRRENGTSVFECPGAAGKMDCHLQPPKRNSRRILLPAANPPKHAVEGSVCSAAFRSFTMQELPLNQRHLYGSIEWHKSYSRRGSTIEPHFAALKDESAEGFRRGNFRVRGLIKTGLMVAFALASTNRRIALSWDRSLVAGVVPPKKLRGRPRRQAWTSLVLVEAKVQPEVVLRV